MSLLKTPLMGRLSLFLPRRSGEWGRVRGHFEFLHSSIFSSTISTSFAAAKSRQSARMRTHLRSLPVFSPKGSCHPSLTTAPVTRAAIF